MGRKGLASAKIEIARDHLMHEQSSPGQLAVASTGIKQTAMTSDRKRNIDAGTRVAVFDLCGTLYFSNTTHDFVRFVVESEDRAPRLFHRAMNSKYSPARYFFIGLSVTVGWDFLRKFNIGLLKRRTREELFELGERFVDEFLTIRRIVEAHELVEECRDRGLQVILCSSSIEPVVAAVAAKVGFDSYVCTTLEYENEIFTGRVDANVTNQKLKNLKENGLECAIDVAISDNAGDLDLLKAARQPYAIAHSKRREEFWKKYSIEILYPTS